MLAQWIGELVGQMHNNKISKSQLAEHMGVSREYVSTGMCIKHKVITLKHQRCKDAERNYIHEKPKGNE